VEVYSTEDQQLEALKRWWKKNGTSIIVGVTVGLAIVVGGRAWIGQQHEHAETASAKFDTMIQAMSQGMDEIALEQSAGLIGQFSDTPYGALAALASAKIKLAQGETLAARTHLKWVISYAEKSGLKQVARVRLARLLLDEEDHQKALALLGEVEAGTFSASIEELRGDIYVAMQQPEKAKAAYNKALDASDESTIGIDLLKMKIDDLGASADSAVDSTMANSMTISKGMPGEQH